MNKSNSQYHVYAKLDLNVVLPLLNNSVVKSRRCNIDINGKSYNPKNGSLRLVTFKRKGTACCYCNRKATHFQLDESATFLRNNPGAEPNPHLNMYSGEYLLTKEHVLPKAWGGKDAVDNMMTCCSECNGIRGDLLLPSINGEELVDNMLKYNNVMSRLAITVNK